MLLAAVTLRCVHTLINFVAEETKICYFEYNHPVLYHSIVGSTRILHSCRKWRESVIRDECAFGICCFSTYDSREHASDIITFALYW